MGPRFARWACALVALSACGSFGEANDAPPTSPDAGGVTDGAPTTEAGAVDGAADATLGGCAHTFCFDFESTPLETSPTPFDFAVVDGTTGAVGFAPIGDGKIGKAMRMTMPPSIGTADHYFAKRFEAVPTPKGAKMHIALRVAGGVGSNPFQVASIGWGRVSPTEDPINEMQIYLVDSKLQLKVDKDNVQAASDFMEAPLPPNEWVSFDITLTKMSGVMWSLGGSFDGPSKISSMISITPTEPVNPVMEIQIGLPFRGDGDFQGAVVDFDDLWVDVN